MPNPHNAALCIRCADCAETAPQTSAEKHRVAVLQSIAKVDPNLAVLAAWARTTGGGLTHLTVSLPDGTVAGGKHDGGGLFKPTPRRTP